jgi:hypothetical protein
MFGLFGDTDPKDPMGDLDKLAKQKGYPSWNHLIAQISVDVARRKKIPEGMTKDEAKKYIEMDLSAFGSRTIVMKKRED